MICASINEWRKDPITSGKADLIYPKVLRIRDSSASIFSYIETLKTELKKKAGLPKDDDKELFRDYDRKSVSQLSLDEKKGEELYQRLIKYKNDLFDIDDNLDSAFRDIVIISSHFDSSSKGHEKFTQTYFTGSVAATLSMLTKLQNNVVTIENRMISYFHSKPSGPAFICEFESTIVAQSCSNVGPGETIEITAGIGSLAWRGKPYMEINGKTIHVGNEGVAKYKLKASAKPGKHSVPVRVSFINQDGKMQTNELNIKYTVTEPCQ